MGNTQFAFCDLPLAMLHGRWTAENRAALEKLLAQKFSYTPIAIFDWDGTCAFGDTADTVFHAQCRDLAFHFDSPEFVAWVEEIPVPTRILQCYEAYRTRKTPEAHAALHFELERTRWALHQSEDDNQAWAWDAGAFVGWTPAQVREYTRRVVARELAQARRVETLTSDDPRALEFARALEPRRAVHDAQSLIPSAMHAGKIHDDHLTLELARGLRMCWEIRDLMYEFRRAGWQVFIITASPQWEIEAFVERYFFPPENVIGMRRAVVNGKITAAFEPPCSWGDGKLDAYQRFVSRARPPNFGAGDSVGDWKLLEWATDAVLVVEPTHDSLRGFARWKQSLGETWLLQKFEG
jgi:phosphoserine phosphatase